MFEAAEIGHTLDKATYDRELPSLREGLLEAQHRVLTAATFPVILVVGGVDGAGKGETVNRLTEWMDPRQVEVHAVGPASDEELERPPMWRFWRRLPPKGKFGIFFGSWYTDPIVQRALDKSRDGAFNDALAEIRRFETMLAAEGALILKFWFHLSKRAQQRRLDELWASKKTRYRVTKQDWKQLAHYDDYRAASERALVQTDTPQAPWLILEGVEERYRNFNTGKALLGAIESRLDSTRASSADRTATIPNVERLPLTRTLDLTRKLEKEDYERKLAKQQRRLALLTLRGEFKRLSPVLVFEGVDAAGKGGAIRRVTQALDARIYDIHPVAAPTDEENRQPYLWRFWRHVPRDGKFAIFDRSWYGRVLVERVEGFADEPDWLRAYGEINDFESQLARAGNVVVKFWLQISKDEQLRRFQERESVAFKRFKITAEDWRNREKWDAYERAASDMIERTSTEEAPWTLVEAEDKYFARVKVLKTICDAIERTL
jgi:polyphosphate:AMP phosphotransferase